jgi:DNA invertase Pin-like site-specific DNA recombinase/ribosomal protein L34E
MNNPVSNPAAGKIRSHHLDRLAVVYVRQSTPKQVLENRESTDRQYQLAARAEALGWRPDRVVVIDDDLGLSGRTAADRAGFQRLLAEVGLDHVGLILGSETSRLARSCKDWYQLLELASVFGVLIADHDGLYDPGQHADRMMLGLSGMMSEAELHVMRNRLDQGKRNKAARGELFSSAPIGYVRGLSGEMMLDPDEQVQGAVRRIFDTFAARGSVRQVLAQLIRDGIRLPVRARGGANRGRVEWREPVSATVYNVLRHPIYAGAYCYGRSRSDPRRKVPGRPLSGRVRVPMEEWAVLLRDMLPAYISWEEYAYNQERLRQNRSSSETSGAPRHGSALLGRLARCARCGWRMHVLYRGRPESPRYVCHRNNPPRPDRPRCPSVSARAIDAVVSQQLLAALAPAALELSLTAAAGLQHEADQRDRDWQLRLERARYETERAHRQYDAAEPENRLVARDLERRWEQALRAERRLKEEFARSRSGGPRELTGADRGRIAALASDIPALWAIAGPAERQAILRHLVEGVEIEATGHSEATRLTMRWAGGGVSRHESVRPVHTYQRLGDFPRLLERIRELMAAGERSGLIASRLNAEGFRSPKGDQRFTADRIRQVVCRFGLRARRSTLPADAPRLKRHEAWMTDLAEELSIPIPTLMAWCKRGWVEARKVEAAVLRWVVWADEKEKSRLKQLAGGRASGLRHPYPLELTTPRRLQNKKACSD